MFFYTLETEKDKISTNVLIGIICGSVAFVFIILGLIIFLIRHKQKNKISSNKNEVIANSSSSTKQHENVPDEVGDLINEEDDQWL